jgi:2',3'-cyclic-nucleotide 2'-phosphodiesterase (5'-nucleotidase family)
MNATGYDVATLGNHEFDYGITAMTANVARCAFPVTSCNLVHRNAADEPGERVLPAYVVVTGGAARVAFVGVTTPTTLVASKPATFLSAKGDYREWDFIAGEKGEAFYAAVQKAVDEASAKADYVVVLGHLGVSADCEPYMSTDLIAHTTNFVALIDGHSHSSMEGARVKNAIGREVILAQTGCYLGALGCLTLDDGACVAASTLFPARTKEPEVEWLETRLIGAVERQLGARLAIVDSAVCSFTPGTGVRLARSQGCAAGDFAADAYWWYAREKAGQHCDFALVNGGNVRADIPKGEVTLKTLRTVQPFGGGVGLVEVDGTTVLDALEFGAQVVGESESGGFLHAAGLRYVIDARIPSSVKVSPSGAWTGGPTGARRVGHVQVYNREKGEYVPLDPAKKYFVAGNSFTLIEGGDGFEMFKRARPVSKKLETDYVALAEYAKAFEKGHNGVPRIKSANSPLAKLKEYPISYEKPEGSGRITILK